ncbi:MAG TPA: hypothetical protein VK589_05980 [Chryseolinea sp.]|nr:hypothetical protein [Chryseolinea sp.]
MTKLPRIYSLSPGGATKYYWFNILQKVAAGEHLRERTKSGLYTFGRYSGTTEADCHASTLGLNFHSDRFTKVIEECSCSTFNKFKIDTQSKLKTKSDYYFVQPNCAIPRIENQDIFSRPDLEKYCSENNTEMTQLLILSTQIYYLYADFGKWNGDDIFTVVDTTLLLVTDKIKLLLEKHALKNIKFKEIPFLS